jgi:hypothetical protein
MAKTVDEILGSLPEEDRGVVGAAIEAVKAEGSKKFSEARGEVTRLLDKYKPLEKALQEAGVDPSDQALAEVLKRAKATGDHSSELEKTVKVLQCKIAEIDADRRATVEKLRTKTLTEKLSGALGSSLLDGIASYVIPGLIGSGSVVLSDDGETVAFNLEGESLTLEKGIEAWKAKNKGLLKNKQAAGSGSAGGKGGGSGSDRPQMARSEWDKLPPKDRARFIIDRKGVLTEG